MEPIPTSATNPATPTTTPIVKSYYAVPVWKFVLLTLLSVIYPTYWFWKNWTIIRAQTGEKFSPLLRALFSFLYLSDYAKTVLASAKAKQYPSSFNPTVIAWIFFIAVVLVVFGLKIAGFAIFIVIPLVKAMAYVNSHTEGSSVQTKITFEEVLVIIVGLAIWALTISETMRIMGTTPTGLDMYRY